MVLRETVSAVRKSHFLDNFAYRVVSSLILNLCLENHVLNLSFILLHISRTHWGIKWTAKLQNILFRIFGLSSHLSASSSPFKHLNNYRKYFYAECDSTRDLLGRKTAKQIFFRTSPTRLRLKLTPYREHRKTVLHSDIQKNRFEDVLDRKLGRLLFKIGIAISQRSPF